MRLWKLTYFLQTLFRPLGAPFRWLAEQREAQRRHERDLMSMQTSAMVEALTQINAQNAALMTEVAKGAQEQARVMQSWLDGFKVVEMPKDQTTAVTDDVEAIIERTKLAERGVPVSFVPADTMKWLEQEFGQPPPEPRSYNPVGPPSSTKLPPDFSRILN